MILNYKFTASNGNVIEGMRTEFDRNYRDEQTAMFFIDNEQNPDGGYYEFNLIKDTDGKLTESAYVAEYPDKDATDPINIINNVEVELTEHDFDNTLKLANAVLAYYQMRIALDYDPDTQLWAICHYNAENKLEYDSDANRTEEVDDAIRDLTLRLEMDAIIVRKHNAAMYEKYYGKIKDLHQEIVTSIVLLMLKHGVESVDLLGSDARHAMVTGYPSEGAGAMTLEVNRVSLKNGELMMDVVLDVDTEELAAQNPNGDISDAYQAYAAMDFSHIIPCAGIDQVYDAVYEVLECGK